MPYSNFTRPHRVADQSIARSIHDLAQYPDVSGDVLCRHARLLGQAGEAFVDSVFMRSGITPLTMPEGLPSDRLFLLPQGAITGQIKIQTRPRNDSYTFSLKKGYRGSPAGCREYDQGDFDIAILVILPLLALKVVYKPGASVRIPVSEVPVLQSHPLRSFWRAVHDYEAEQEVHLA